MTRRYYVSLVNYDTHTVVMHDIMPDKNNVYASGGVWYNCTGDPGDSWWVYGSYKKYTKWVS